MEPFEELIHAIGRVGKVEEHFVDFLTGRIRHDR